MKLATSVAAGLVLASPAQADDFPTECSASLTALTISGVEAFCKDLRVTSEGGLLAQKLIQRGDCEKIAYNQLQLDLERLGARPNPNTNGMDNTEAWCDYAQGALERSLPDSKAVESR